jgi:integrase
VSCATANAICHRQRTCASKPSVACSNGRWRTRCRASAQTPRVMSPIYAAGREVEEYENHHRIGSTARLALALLLYTGQRRSDVVLFGRQHVRHGSLRFTQQKNRNRKPITLELPILPVLQTIIDATKTGDLTFLVNDYGQPFTGNGFGNKMRQWCNEAGLPHCTSHGLRKTGAVIEAENGATAHELMSIFGWLTLKEAERHTRAAEQHARCRCSNGVKKEHKCPTESGRDCPTY